MVQWFGLSAELRGVNYGHITRSKNVLYVFLAMIYEALCYIRLKIPKAPGWVWGV